MSEEWKRIFSSVIGLVESGGTVLPNIADRSSRESIRLSHAIIDWLGAGPLDSSVAQTKGSSFESAVRTFIERSMRPGGRIRIHQRQVAIDQFSQYRHLESLDDATSGSPLLRATMTGDYRIRPDIVMSRRSTPPAPEEMFASISCKFTLRSDRAQNARSEALNLLRLRSGPAPRIALVTAEPLPARLDSIARGTGDLDHVFHVALPALLKAAEDRDGILRGLVEAGRLRPITDLVPYLGLQD